MIYATIDYLNEDDIPTQNGVVTRLTIAAVYPH